MAEPPADDAEFDPGTILNQGVIVRAAPSRGRKRAAQEKTLIATGQTLIATGLARSGTSMVAAVLLEAGI